MNRDGRRGGFLASEEGVKKLKEAKRIKKYSYQKIADEAHVTEDQVKRLFNPHWGNGQYKIGEEALEAIARVLDLDPTDIVDPDEWNPPVEQNQHDAVCRFLAEIENSFKYIRLLHIREQRIVLQDQYIPIQVTLERKYKHEVETIYSYAESEAELKRVYALKHQEDSQPTQVDWAEAKKQHQRIMVLADPGMGKSTLLKMEAGLTAQSERKSLESNGKKVEDAILPLFLRLSNLVDEKQADIFSAEIIDAIPLILGKEYCKTLQDDLETAAVIGHVLKEKLRTGKCLLLLDALDEVPQKHRQYLSEKLNRFVGNYPCSIICTSRIVGYGGVFLDGAKEVEIVPFSQKQTEEYIEFWFKNAAGYLNDDAVSAPALMRELRNKPQIRGLAQNPLLLSLICSLYQEKGLTLPARRCQVYEKAVSYMLGKWSQNRQPQNEGRIIAKTRLLAELAYHFTCEGQEIFSRDELYDQIEEYLQGERVPTGFKDADTGELIAELSEQDGILQKLHEDGDYYLFLHRTFQEYLTACYLNRAKDGIDRAKAHFWEYEWHETLSLMAGLMKNPVPLLEAIRKEKDDIFSTQLLLAGRCIAECKDISHSLIVDSIDRIYQFWCRYSDAEFIESVVVALGQTNIKMVEKLQQALNDEDWYVREKAAEALGNIGNPQAVPALIAALKDKDSFSRTNAAEALGNIGNPQAVDALIAALNYEDWFVRIKAGEALGKIGNPQAVDVLMSALNHEDMSVSMNAAEALGKIDNLQAVDALMLALNDEDQDVRRKAAEVLGKIGNSQAVDALMVALNDEDQDVRTNAAEALGKIGHPQAVDALIADLKDQHKWVRWKAPEALGKIGNPQAVPALIAALNHEDGYMRWKAAEALGKIGNPQAVPALIAALNHEDVFVRRYAAEALGKIGNPQAVPALIAALKHEYWYVKEYVAEALGKIGNPQAVDALIAALKHEDESVRRNAVEALGKIGNPQAVPVLIAALKDEDSSVRTNAAEALGNIGNPQAVDALIAALNDEYELVRWKAAKALGKIDSSETLAKLIQNPEIDIYDSDIFVLARKLAVRFSKEGVPFIPVYPELLNREADTDA
ncbi:HEAT repeat domain-containing protein [Microseira wollei]|uniref:Peptidase C14, caspase catalytic subunit p20 n=1 Tax=Microseira wollei NIES-4236 TaxID=2530354 RepID=A0AAV3XGT5_9CYAN|nr:HEAT repeat domain-containing protein [Microseira wollei]GET40636.1 peptidase C14, caspase catalytic subunit p20 [Microseira wollei NIES-4236]